MRKALFTLALLASAFTLTAHADTIDDFLITGNGESVTFSLPATTDGYILHAHFNSFFESALGTIDGSPVTLGALFYVGYFAGSPPGIPALGIGSTPPTSFPLDLYGFIPYTFNEVPAQFPNPSDEGTVYFTFVPGTYELKDSPYTPGLAYTLTITPETSTAATPEPTTLLLFATGMIGLVSGGFGTWRLSKYSGADKSQVISSDGRQSGNNPNVGDSFSPLT